MKQKSQCRYRVGEVVCVAIRIHRRLARWCIGIILQEPIGIHKKYLVSVYCQDDIVKIGEVILQHLPCVSNLDSQEDQQRQLLLQRISSETFLKAFVEGRVLSSRQQYMLSADRLCSANPKVVFERMFNCT